ncbi:alpha/beta-hydrolase [Rickenella mellea]|uniref:Alpha/beta-hydrolase n=1 Tax=Rickenella mellea TaxID=50990 RepID=A0A4Y7QLF4_9AGAM|nr:alpha/beta-hydrolase [Rickenella mellea]
MVVIATILILILPTLYMFPIPVHHSLESVPVAAKVRQIYPDDIYPGGAYVVLPHGKVRFWLFGPESGTKVVLIHGISTPSVAWKDVAPVLASKGFRVLTYDLYGRGYSQAPQTTYDTTLYITQPALLMQFVCWDNAHIVGLSMGGGITAAFAATFPHLVSKKIVLIASVGLMSESDVTTGNIPAMPLTAELRTLQEQHLPGYRDALKSSVKHGPLRGLDTTFSQLGKNENGFDFLIIHGTSDNVVNFENAKAIQKLVPSAELIPVEGAGHDLLVVSPFHEMVTEALLKFLAGNMEPAARM